MNPTEKFLKETARVTKVEVDTIKEIAREIFIEVLRNKDENGKADC